MARSNHPVQHRGGWVFVPPTVTLAFQRVRETWGLLLVTGVGMLAAVMLVCTVPLYSKIAMTAGLRDVLNSYSQNADIVVHSVSMQISLPYIDKATTSLNREFQNTLGPYLASSQFSIETRFFPILAVNTAPGGASSLKPTGDSMGLIGSSMDLAASHVHVVQGRLPLARSNEIEIAIRPEIATDLSLKIGSVLPVSITSGDLNNQQSRTLLLHVVGIFTLAKPDDPFWHGHDFLGSSKDNNFVLYESLASNETILATLAQTGPGPGVGIANTYQVNDNLIWYYHLDTDRISVDDLDTIINKIQTVTVDDTSNSDLNQSPFLQQTTTFQPSDALQQFRSRLSVAQFPVISLLLLVFGLVLYFVTMMSGLLVDRQSDAIAVLRSRGASRRQILGSLVTQGIGLGLIALLAGPLLAIVMTRLLAQNTLSPTDQGALNLIDGNPLQVALGLGQYALAAVLVTIAAIILAVLSASRRDVLALRREAARSTHRPAWQRLNLDLVVALLALLSYGAAVYLTNSGVLDARLHLLLLSPLTLVEAICLLLAFLLLLLRFFPLLLQAGAWIAMRRRGATPLIALAQMARAPRQSMRMTLLLALTSAFAIFTLIFTATQSQRTLDVATYQAGADFSGPIPLNLYTPQQLNSMTSAYRHLPGATSATLGLTRSATAGGATLNIPIDFKAVDANTFASTALWSQQDSSQSLHSLIAQLSARRDTGISSQIVPAIVDANTASTLHLSQGSNFTLNFSPIASADLVNFKVVALVQNIPTSGDSSMPGVLVDFQTFADVYTHHFTRAGEFAVPLNYVWVRTKDDASSVASVRKALSHGNLQLQPLFDRRAIIDTLYHEPLNLTLFGILALGAVTALLLALVGNLIASWLSARSRLTNFAVLRALGAAPRQVAGVLTWEQGIIYVMAILLGLIFGTILSALVLPALIFSSVLPSQITGNISPSQFYAVQSVPSINIVIPASLLIALGTLIVICVVALGMMVFIVSRPSIGQTLRLNED
jgi:ABC-type antimicrobial peptide transport system permease subunit